jgi:hypothetical protein
MSQKKSHIIRATENWAEGTSSIDAPICLLLTNLSHWLARRYEFERLKLDIVADVQKELRLSRLDFYLTQDGRAAGWGSVDFAKQSPSFEIRDLELDRGAPKKLADLLRDAEVVLTFFGFKSRVCSNGRYEFDTQPDEPEGEVHAQYVDLFTQALGDNQ